MKYAGFDTQGETIPPLRKRWWEMFRRRHKNLSIRRPDTQDRGRAQCATHPTMDTFTFYEKHLKESGLKEKPRQIYNCSESGFRSNQSRHKVLAPRGAKHAYQQAMETKEHITVPASTQLGRTFPRLSSTPSVSPLATIHWEPPPQPCMCGQTVVTLTGTCSGSGFSTVVHPLLLLFDGPRGARVRH